MKRALAATIGIALLFGSPALGGARAQTRRGPTAGTPAIVGLDHIPIAVENLERAAERYQALGFVLETGTPHENGIRNQHVKFPDGT